MDLMIGLPQQRGSEWVSALRNLGVYRCPGDGDGNNGSRRTSCRWKPPSPLVISRTLIFKTTAKLVRVEIDPEKLYPQLDYANDSAPRSRDVAEAIAEATRFFGAQDYTKAESMAREILCVLSPHAGGSHHPGPCAAGTEPELMKPKSYFELRWTTRCQLPARSRGPTSDLARSV